MLSPARPRKDDPMYQEKMNRYRSDIEDMARNPHNWGIVRGESNEPPQIKRRGRPRKSDGE